MDNKTGNTAQLSSTATLFIRKILYAYAEEYRLSCTHDETDLSIAKILILTLAQYSHRGAIPILAIS